MMEAVVKRKSRPVFQSAFAGALGIPAPFLRRSFTQFYRSLAAPSNNARLCHQQHTKFCQGVVKPSLPYPGLRATPICSGLAFRFLLQQGCRTPEPPKDHSAAVTGRGRVSSWTR